MRAIVDETIWIRAGRTIRRGDALTYNDRVIGERTTRAAPGGMSERAVTGP